MPILLKTVQNKWFRFFYTSLAVLFVIGAPFITLKPSVFLPLGYFGVFLFNMVGSGLLIISAFITKLNVFLLILSCALGNIFNTSLNYLVGKTSNSMFHKLQFMDKIKRMLERFQVPMIFALALAPLPVDVNGLLSGYMDISYKKYILVNFLGKIALFSIASIIALQVKK